MKKGKKRILIVFLVVAVLVSGCAIGLPGQNRSKEKKLSAIQMLIDQYYLEDTKEAEFEEGIYKGYVEQLGDPYSVYYTKKEYEEMMEDDSGHYVGIGVVFSQNMTNKQIMVTRVFDDGPAFEAGLEQYDILAAINGESIDGMELSDVVKKIRGGEGESIKLTIYRDGKKMVVESKRRAVDSQMVDSQMLEDGIGYIAIYEFIETTYEQFHQAYEELQKEGMKALVLDLRSNPGGFLDQVQKVADDFIPKGSVIVSTEDKQGNKEYLKAETEEQIEVPLAVLIDGYSASASEILAGAIKDYELGTLIGQKTFGKGIVQRIFPLSDGSAVKLTISKYYTPNGSYIHEKGIEPDIVLKNMYLKKKDDTLEDDTWVKKAVKHLKKQLKD